MAINHEIQNITPELFSTPVFNRNEKMGKDACEILVHALTAVDPYESVKDLINIEKNLLYIKNKQLDLINVHRIFIIGFGKASIPMVQAILDKLGKKINRALIITKDLKFKPIEKRYRNLSIYFGGHPIPTEESIESTQNLLNNLPDFTEDDLVFVLVSGGGSALFTDPVQGVSLDDMRALTQILLNCGADIDEVNTLRKHLDLVKGGRLAQRLHPARVETIILSDVIGDRLDVIASGPTVADPTTYHDAIAIVDRYKIRNTIPPSIINCFEKGQAGLLTETLKPGSVPEGRVNHYLVGTNLIATKAASTYAQSIGYLAKVINTEITTRTDHAAEYFQKIFEMELSKKQTLNQPLCLIFGGEPTVLVTGKGLGGRNMDLTLRMVKVIASKPKVLFTSFATDGEDGPTDAAGAVADGFVYAEGRDKFCLNLDEYIKNSDSYHYFEKVGGLIKTGATGTNVNDIMLLMIAKD